MQITIDNNGLQQLQYISDGKGDSVDNRLQNMQVNSVISNGFLQQLGSGPVTIDNNHLQNLSWWDSSSSKDKKSHVKICDSERCDNGPVKIDGGKISIHGKEVADLLQNLQVNSVISNGFLQNLLSVTTPNVSVTHCGSKPCTVQSDGGHNTVKAPGTIYMGSLLI